MQRFQLVLIERKVNLVCKKSHFQKAIGWKANKRNI